MNEVRRQAAAHVFVEPDTLLATTTVSLDDDVTRHLDRVLRLRDGESVTMSDGAGWWQPGRIVRHQDVLSVEPTAERRFEAREDPPFTLMTAIPKGDRVDWLVQKATELGADRIEFVDAERSTVRWRPDRVAKQMARLSRVALEAARQSRRVHLVELVAPAAATELLPRAVVADFGGRPVTRDDRTVAVGPEGGWTEREQTLARDVVSLGPTVLRTETAGLAATTLCVVRGH